MFSASESSSSEALALIAPPPTTITGRSALRSNLLEDRKAKLHDVVLLARQAVDLNYQASHQAGLSDAEALERGKALLRTLRFGKDDYFYAFSPQGLVQSHPNPKVENKNLYEVPDSDGVFFTRQQIELAAQGGGFVGYRPLLAKP